MKATVTFETAKALRDAGFPQPEPAPGQFWYNQKGLLHVVFIEGGEGRCFLSVDDGDAWPCVDEGYIFAPQAHDTLAQLPKGVWGLSKGEDLWHVLIETFNRILESDKSPHEAAAKAYLQLHKTA